MPELRSFISVLEEQSRLLQLPREQWPAAAVQEQIKAIAMQLIILRNRIANYRTTNPSLSRNRAIIDLLEQELRSLQR